MIQEFHLRLRDLLNHIIAIIIKMLLAEMIDKVLIGNYRYSRTGCGSDVYRNPVGLPVIYGG
jgi:hypothetical protein